MQRADIINVLSKFAENFDFQSAEYIEARTLAGHKNPWFIPEHVDLAMQHILSAFLDKEKLENFVTNYPEAGVQKSVGLVLSGNLPLVGFHDVLCVILSGHKAFIKPSSKDDVMLKFVLDQFGKIELEFNELWEFAERLNDLDAYIATGSDNTARYFKAYFSGFPNIIRQNRNSVAVLTGNETKEQLVDLGKDVFTYFGLGCRNVSKLLVPKGYDFQFLLDCWQENYAHYVMHSSYKNNYDYNYTIYLMNKMPFLMGGSVLLLENSSYASRIACLHYSQYENQQAVFDELQRDAEKIQCVVAGKELNWPGKVNFGETQIPQLDQFADDIDTMKFLSQWSR